MKAHVIALKSDAYNPTIDHLKSHGVEPSIWWGFNNKTEWALETLHTYDVDNPGTGYRLSRSVIGCALGHWTLWKALDYLGQEDYYHIMEADVRLRLVWKSELESALKDLPEDWDLLYPGSCCAEAGASHYKNNLFITEPLCNHWYVVRHKALKTLIEDNSKAEGPLDVQMRHVSFKKLKVFTILPRIADQHNNDLVS
jgi:GR25 family glycosyltransferase involved in LPS biosynthesis